MGLTEIAVMRGVLKGARKGTQSAMQVIQVLNEKERIAAEKAEKKYEVKLKRFKDSVSRQPKDPIAYEEAGDLFGINLEDRQELLYLQGTEYQEETGNDLVGLHRFLNFNQETANVEQFDVDGEIKQDIKSIKPVITEEEKRKAVALFPFQAESQRKTVQKEYFGEEEGITLIPEAADWAGVSRDKKLPHNKAMEINASWRRFAKPPKPRSSGKTSEEKANTTQRSFLDKAIDDLKGIYKADPFKVEHGLVSQEILDGIALQKELLGIKAELSENQKTAKTAKEWKLIVDRVQSILKGKSKEKGNSFDKRFDELIKTITTPTRKK